MSRSGSVFALLVFTTSLLAAQPARAQDKPPTSRLIQLGMPHVAKRGTSNVLVQTVTTTSSSTKDKFWALVEMNAPEGSRSCEWLKELGFKQTYRFECPLQNAVGQKYVTRVRVYSDPKLGRRELFYEPTLTITQPMLAAAGNAPADSPVPDGVFDAVDTPLPVTLKPTWYRRVDKGFGLRAYENSGDFTVTTDEIVFVDGKMSVRIPRAKILSVKWEPLQGDIANHWVAVRFVTDEGKPDGVAFRDGGRLGTRGNTGPIFLAARRAAIK